MTKPRLLCVDDEPNVLEGLSRNLRRKFEVTTCTSGDAALRRLDEGEAFEVIVSDMRMPSMNGAELLARFRERTPDTIRLLLTGYAEIEAAMTAVNDGQIFRFLMKPCSTETLTAALDAAVAQYRLQTAERVLLEQTLVGSMRALTEALALARPDTFIGQARQHERARKIADKMRIPDSWHVEVASMLSSVGYVLLPADVVSKVHSAAALDQAERDMLKRLPEVLERVIASIPRLEQVRAVLKYDALHPMPVQGETAPPGASILAVLRALAAEEARNPDTSAAIAAVKRLTSRFEPALLEAMEAVCEPTGREVRRLRVTEVRPGMVFAADVKAMSGLLLVGRGQRATEPLLERLRNFAFRIGIVEPILCEAE